MGNDHPLLKRKLQVFLITAAFIVLTIVSVVFFLINVRIQTVNLENCVYSNQESVLEAASIAPGTHSYGIDKSKISSAIKRANPYVIDVRIKRTGINSISIILTEDAPCFYIEKNGEYIVLSETLRVLARYASLTECAHKVNHINLMPITEAEIGTTVVFEKPSEENIDLSLLSSADARYCSRKIRSGDLSENIKCIRA